MTESDSNNSKGGTLSLPFILFILNIVVIANTSRNNFKSLGHELYYDFELFNLVIIGVFFAYFIIYTIGQVAAATNENKTLIFILNIGMLVVGLSYIVTTLYYMGSIWHEDPKHSILYYEEYWKESVMDFRCLNTTQLNTNLTQSLRNGNVCRVYDKKWAYIMSDVVVRIYSFILIILFSIVLPIIVCCLGCFKGFSNRGGSDYLIYSNK